MDNMNQKTKTKPQASAVAFHAWLDAEEITLPEFAGKAKLGLSTVASLRAKSLHGIRTVLHRGTADAIRKAYPACPLLSTAVIL